MSQIQRNPIGYQQISFQKICNPQGSDIKQNAERKKTCKLGYFTSNVSFRMEGEINNFWQPKTKWIQWYKTYIKINVEVFSLNGKEVKIIYKDKIPNR